MTLLTLVYPYTASSTTNPDPPDGGEEEQPPVVDCPENNCPPECENVFSRVHVTYLIRGGTRIMWDLYDDFTDPLPHTFQLQVGRTGNQNADDWTDVGLAIDNTFYAIDGEQRIWGKSQFTHYRLKLTTSKGVYYSEPTNGMGVLGQRDWRIAKEILRQEKLRMRYAACEGYLLKRRIFGPKCNLCLDWQTGEVRDPNCDVCYGTGFQCGYFYPMGCIWADLDPEAHMNHLDDQGVRGTVSDIVVKARMLAVPLIQEYDVWVNAATDDRYYIRSIRNKAETRNIALVSDVELRLAPASDIIYDVEIPEQISRNSL